MKISIPISSLLAAVLLAVAVPNEIPPSARLVQAVGQPVAIDDTQLRALEMSLEKAGLSGLLKTAKEITPDGCPTIFSKGYCDRLNSGGKAQEKSRADHENRVRNFGKRILAELDAESKKLSRPGIEAAEARAKAEEMLALSDWFLKGDGYGNGVIASRCRQLGAVAASQVVIADSIPIEEASSLVDSLAAFGEAEWFQWLIRAHEREAPNAIAPFVGAYQPLEPFRFPESGQ